jgi:DNA (cytosine-5)-methyltransferase 1
MTSAMSPNTTQTNPEDWNTRTHQLLSQLDASPECDRALLVELSWSAYSAHCRVNRLLASKTTKKTIRVPNLESHFSENLLGLYLWNSVRLVLCWNGQESGDGMLIQFDPELSRIIRRTPLECKATSGIGPISFSPKAYLDQELWIVIVHREKNQVQFVKRTDSIDSIQVSKKETIGDQRNAGKRPRLLAEQLVDSNQKWHTITSVLDTYRTHPIPPHVEKMANDSSQCIGHVRNGERCKKPVCKTSKTHQYCKQHESQETEQKEAVVHTTSIPLQADTDSDSSQLDSLSEQITQLTIVETTPTQLRHVDLCAGSGAFSLALSNTGRFHTVYANDLEPKCKPVFDTNIRDVKLTVGDITTIPIDSIPGMDIITAGFPCQPFSIAGERKGLNDPRSNVFGRIVDMVKHHKPRFVLCENVFNLLAMEKGQTFKTLIDLFKQHNPEYCFKHMVYDTCEHTGIPHHRKRVYMIWFKWKEDHGRFAFPQHKVDKKRVSAFLEHKVDDQYFYDNKQYKDWRTIQTAVTKNVHTTNTVFQYRKNCVRENKSGDVPTLTANMGKGGHNVPLILDGDRVRKLTPRECFRFQGFSDSYTWPGKTKDSTLYAISGNAITLPLAQMIGAELVKLLK